MEAPQNIKAYRSPILLLKSMGFNSDSYSEDDIKKAIEKFDHDFVNGSVVIDGLSYPAEEAIEALHNTNEFNWEHHVIIYKYKGFLHFLEKNVFEKSELESARQFRYKPSFVKFVSPYFARSFEKIASRLIKNKDLLTLKEIIEYSGFISSPYDEIAFKPIIDYLETFVNEAKLLEASGLFPDEEQRQSLLSDKLVTVFNSLPAFAMSWREEYLQLLLSVFRHSLRNVSPEVWVEGWSVLKKIHGSNEQETEKELLEKSMPHKKTSNRFFSAVTENMALWSVGIFCILGLLLIISLMRKKEVKPEEVILSGTFGGREGGDYASVEDQLASSTNESNFRYFIRQLCKASLPGSQRNIQTGDSPFQDLSTLPPSQGNSTLNIRNSSVKDAVVLYFTSNNTLINEQSRVYAAFIRHGDSFTFPFDANFGRLNFVFGNNWRQLKNPIAFPLYKPSDNVLTDEAPEETERRFWRVNQFFFYPDPGTYYLEHYLTIQDFEQPNSKGAPLSKLLNEPSKTELYSREPKHVKLVLSGNNVRITGTGNLYVYLSP